MAGEFRYNLGGSGANAQAADAIWGFGVADLSNGLLNWANADTISNAGLFTFRTDGASPAMWEGHASQPGQTLALYQFGGFATPLSLANDGLYVDWGAISTSQGLMDGKTIPALSFAGGGSDQGHYVAGGALADAITGGDGADQLAGGGGTDTLFGGAGDDGITGGAAVDLLLYDATADGQGVNGALNGLDTLADFDPATDQLQFSANNLTFTDFIYDADNDALRLAQDTVNGVVFGGDTPEDTDFDLTAHTDPTDFTSGTTGVFKSLASGNGATLNANDPGLLVLAGTTTNSTVAGGAGNDRLMDVTSQDNDLEGGDGDDTLHGGGGDNRLSSGGGTDILYGGGGNDTFVGTAAAWDGDTLEDFALGDLLLLDGLSLANDLDGETAGNIDLGGGQTLTLNDVGNYLFAAQDVHGGTEVTLTAAPSPGPTPSPGPSPSPSPSPAPDSGGGSPAPAPAPSGGNVTIVTTDDDGQAVDTRTEAVPGGTKIAVGTDSATGEEVLSVVVPDNANLQVEGPPAAEEKTAAGGTAKTKIAELVPDAATQAQIDAKVDAFVANTAEGTSVLVRTFTPSLTTTGQAATLEVSGNSAGDTVEEAVIIDLSDIGDEDVTINVTDVGFVTVVGWGTLRTFGSDAKVVVGDDGIQVMELADGTDDIAAGGGNDRVQAGGGNDQAAGGNDDDVIYGNRGDDAIYGNRNDDTMYGGQNADDAFGGQDGDIVYGNRADDAVYGNRGNDTVYGGQDDDGVFGGTGTDILHGNVGADTLNGGLGDDELFGGTGADLFVLSDGADRVRDFSTAEGDRLMVAAGDGGNVSAAELLAMMSEDPDGNAVLSYQGQIITLEGVSLADLTAEDILVL